MSGHIEGTYRLDGLVEGPLPDQPGSQQRLAEWARKSKPTGAAFDVQIDHGGFSALASERVLEIASQPQPIEDIVTETLDDLLNLFPPSQRGRLLSTVRSLEYRPNEEGQTLYAVGPNGRIVTEQRSVEATTTAPPEPATPRDIVKLAAITLLILALGFGISSFFVDYHAIWRDFVRQATPLSADSLAIEYDSFLPYFTVEETLIEGGNRRVVLTLKRTGLYPSHPGRIPPEVIDQLDLPNRLALEAVARGRIQAEWFDEKDHCIAYTTVRIADLALDESIKVAVDIPRQTRPTRLKLTY
jgi:hypothetical protein